MAACAPIFMFHGSVWRFYRANTREHLHGFPSHLSTVRGEYHCLRSPFDLISASAWRGTLDLSWEQGGSRGQWSHVFRTLMARKMESKLFLHESEESAVSFPLWFIKTLATLYWSCFLWASQKFVQVPFPESRTFCLLLDMVFIWPWSNNQRAD